MQYSLADFYPAREVCAKRRVGSSQNDGIAMLTLLGVPLVSSVVLAPPRAGPALQSGRASAPAMRAAWPSTPLQAVQHLPLLAAPSAASYAALPILYDTWQAAAPADKLGPFLALLLTKRLTLYACALVTVYVAAMRSGDAAAGLGERLERITAEAVFPATLPEGQTEEIRVVAKQLDETPAAAQAAGLPLLFAALLASAYVRSYLAP